MIIEEHNRKTQSFRPSTALMFATMLSLSTLLILPTFANGSGFVSQRRNQTRKSARQPAAKPPKIDYSRFSHRTSRHGHACETCHNFPSANWQDVRAGDTAFPDVTEYPRHAACISCHGKQFFRGVRPVICSVCHVSVSPKKSPRFPYPSLGESFFDSVKGRDFASDFNINFPHDKHIEIISRLGPEREPAARVRFVTVSFEQEQPPDTETSCKVCHQTYQPQGDSADDFVTPPPKDWPDGAFWLKKGAFKSVPMTHAVCFSCHSEDSGLPPAPTDCNTCHKLPTAEQLAQAHSDFDPSVATMMGINDSLTLMKWRKRETAAFRHEWFSHVELSCASCHNVATINTLNEQSKKVPIKSCGGNGEGCHITATTDDGGILNYVVEQRKFNPAFQCRKCHAVFGKQQIPQSHLDAVAAFKKK